MKTCPIFKVADQIADKGKHKTDCILKNCGMYQHCFNITSTYRDPDPLSHLEDPPDEEEARSWSRG